MRNMSKFMRVRTSLVLIGMNTHCESSKDIGTGAFTKTDHFFNSDKHKINKHDRSAWSISQSHDKTGNWQQKRPNQYLKNPQCHFYTINVTSGDLIRDFCQVTVPISDHNINIIADNGSDSWMLNVFWNPFFSATEFYLLGYYSFIRKKQFSVTLYNTVWSISSYTNRFEIKKYKGEKVI